MKKRNEYKRPAPSYRDRLRRYEQGKATIEATATSFDEYQERVKKLAKELRI